MGNKTIISLSLVAICVSLLLGSCEKKQQATTIYDRIPGSWKLAKYGSDDNLNGVIDNYEMHTVALSQDNQMTFKADGTGITSNTDSGIKEPDLAFVWQLKTIDSLWVAYRSNDTLNYYIANITSAGITLTTYTNIENTNVQGINWFYFARE